MFGNGSTNDIGRYKYLKYTNDYDFILKEIYPILEEIIINYKDGIYIDDNNIYLDIDGLIESLGSLGKMSFSILLLVVTGIIVLISWYLAQKVIYKKEF